MTDDWAMWVVVLVSASVVLLNGVLLWYLHDLERRGCTCALGWKRRFIELAEALYIALALLAFVHVGCGPAWIAVYAVLVTALNVAYVVVTRMFIHDVRRDGCECAEGAAFNLLDIVNAFEIGWAIAAALMVIAFAVMLTTNYGDARARVGGILTEEMRTRKRRTR